MNLPFITSFLKNSKNTTNKTLELPKSLLIKKLQDTAIENGLHIFENINIYHHAQHYFIPLLILDESRGLFIFEHKDWSYDDLKNAKIEKASKLDSTNNTLAFEKSHEYIRRKFNEITHTDGVPIFNYLLMENLNESEYSHLSSSFQKLLPQDKIMFNDSSTNTILSKIMKSAVSEEKLPSASDIMCTLLVQYAILDEAGTFHLASNEQRKFINYSLPKDFTLLAAPGSGKTSSILLKAIVEKLKNPALKIIIIKPTILSCEILKRKLIDCIEHAIIEIDVTLIQIITPKEFMKKPLKVADLIICDDSELYSQDFIGQLKLGKTSLIMVENSKKLDDPRAFTKNYKNVYKENNFIQTNPHAKALQLISSLLETNSAKDILVVCSNSNKDKLQDDLEYFIKDEAILLDSSKSIVDQDLDTLILSSYDDIHSLDVKFAILMDVCDTDVKKLRYAYNLPKNSVYVLYEEKCKNLALIKG
ncbi:DEAD/DEAH box helicase family protein [Sulfurimonas sp.]